MAETKKSNSRVIVYGTLLLLLAIGSGAYYFLQPAPHIHVKLHEIKLNSLEFDSLNVTGETINDINKKSHVLMVFFTLNCPETKKNIERFNKLNKRDDIAVIGYMMSGSKRAKKYAQNYNVDFPLAKASKYYMKTFEPNVTPMAFLTRTSDLMVRDKYVGEIIPHKVITKMQDIF